MRNFLRSGFSGTVNTAGTATIIMGSTLGLIGLMTPGVACAGEMHALNVQTSLTLQPVHGEGAAAAAGASSSTPATTAAPASSSADAGEVPKVKRLYLEPGPMYLTLGGGVAHNFNSATDVNGFAQISTFVAPKFELGFELGGWYFDQPGKNAEGISGTLAMKYHFWHSEKRDWTLFGELGIGVLVASRQVPAGGTNVDFLPRAGAGLTWEVAEGVRLVGGVRWHHISNARLKGDSRNPSRDGVMGYVGVSFALP